VKTRSCPSVDTAAAAMLCYAIQRTGSAGYNDIDTWPGYDHKDAFTPPRFYLWKSAILDCIQIPAVVFSFYRAAWNADAVLR